MPLSQPAERELHHQRAIEVRGYQRTDGLFDIDAHLVDTRGRDFHTEDRGLVAVGEPLHEMWVRLTVDEEMTILGCEAVTEHGPFALCGGGAATMPRLVGLSIKAGFLKAANERLKGVEGCTHLRELLQQIATTAFQTIWPLKKRRQAAAQAAEAGPARPRVQDGSLRLLNTCFAYASGGEVVRRRWPDLYTGPEAPTSAPPQAAAAKVVV